MPGPQFAQRALDDRGLPAGYPLQDGWEVTPREVKRRRDAGTLADPQADEPGDGQTLLLDVRTPAEVDTARIDGARCVPMGEIAARLPELEAFADGPVVVSCHHGGRSMQVTQYLRNKGFSKVQNLAGGIDEYSQQIDPSVPRY